jgi:hypothetical protein
MPGAYLKGNSEYIKKRIRKYLEYSPQAKRMAFRGLCMWLFTITKDGSAQNVELRTSAVLIRWTNQRWKPCTGHRPLRRRRRPPVVFPFSSASNSRKPSLWGRRGFIFSRT